MIIQFTDPVLLTQPRWESPRCPSMTFATQTSLQLTCMCGAAIIPLSTRNVVRWELILTRGYGDRRKELYSAVYAASVLSQEQLTLPVLIQTNPAFQYVEGKSEMPCLLTIKGFTSASRTGLVFNVSLPVGLKSNEAALPSFDAVISAQKAQEAASYASAADAAADRAEEAAESIPQPTAADEGKIIKVIDGELAFAQETQGGIPIAEKGTANGVATLDANVKIPVSQIPSLSYVPGSRKVNGKALSADITLNASDVSAIASSAKGAANGVATLDSTGKVPSGQLPAITSEDNDTITLNVQNKIQAVGVKDNSGITRKVWKGTKASYISEGKAQSTDICVVSDDLDSNAVLDAFISGSTVSLKNQQGNVVIPMASGGSGGVLGCINEQNGLYQSGQWTVLSVPSTAQIDSREAGKRAITPALLDYAVRSVLPNITSIPAASASSSLLDASATTNSHSFIYTHTPVTAPVYTLPDISDTTVQHIIQLTVVFSSVTSLSFQTSGGTVIPMLITPSIAVNDIWEFLCEYSSEKPGWIIYPVKKGSIA